MSEGKIIFTRDENAREVAVVSLQDGRKGACIIDKEDYFEILALGMSMALNRLPNGHITSPCSRSPTNHVYVARVITGAGIGEVVVYRDGDPSNLRRSNLVVVAGRATKCDRDFLRSKKAVVYGE